MSKKRRAKASLLPRILVCVGILLAIAAIIFPAMDALRDPVDQLEMIVDKEAWPMPSYGDLIFEV